MMKLLNIIFLSLLCLSHNCFANNYSEINYRLTPIFSENKPILKVEAEIKGEMSNKVILDLPHAWASGFYADQIKNVKLEFPKGKLQLKQTDENQAILTIPKTDIIRLSYEIHQKQDDPVDVHEVIIRNNLIHSSGYGLFTIPEDLSETKATDFTITWQNLPSRWQTISSYGIDKIIKLHDNQFRLIHAIYAAGDLRITQIAKPTSPAYLALYGNFEIKDDELTSTISKIINSQRAFFNDNDFPYYVMSLIEGDDPGSMGGTGLANSFTAFLPKGMKKREYYILLAHEHFHNWIGGKIRNNKDEKLNYWWSEGFTDYYSRVIALRSGIITMEEFIDEFNQFLRNYYLSPAINEPNSKIKADFWKDYTIEKLPYYRGLVFAMYLNNLIKINNQNHSLDNIMLDLFKTAKEHKFSVTYFKNIAKSYISKGIDKEIAEFIDQGRTIDLSSLTNILPIEKVKMGTYDRGFNRDALINDNIIKNIDEKSNSYKSGLRNGDKVIGYDFPAGSDPDQIVTVTTDTGEFKYRPESPNKKEAYQFKPDLSEIDKEQIKNFFGVE